MPIATSVVAKSRSCSATVRFASGTMEATPNAAEPPSPSPAAPRRNDRARSCSSSALTSPMSRAWRLLAPRRRMVIASGRAARAAAPTRVAASRAASDAYEQSPVWRGSAPTSTIGSASAAALAFGGAVVIATEPPPPPKSSPKKPSTSRGDALRGRPFVYTSRCSRGARNGPWATPLSARRATTDSTYPLTKWPNAAPWCAYDGALWRRKRRAAPAQRPRE